MSKWSTQMLFKSYAVIIRRADDISICRIIVPVSRQSTECRAWVATPRRGKGYPEKPSVGFQAVVRDSPPTGRRTALSAACRLIGEVRRQPALDLFDRLPLAPSVARTLVLAHPP